MARCLGTRPVSRSSHGYEGRGPTRGETCEGPFPTVYYSSHLVFCTYITAQSQAHIQIIVNLVDVWDYGVHT